MRCPDHPDVALEARQTTSGVELDRCPECSSIWFDRGEITFFLKNPRALSRGLAQAGATTPGAPRSPRRDEPMVPVSLGDARVWQEPSSGGIWLPGAAASALQGVGGLSLAWSDEGEREPLRVALPNLVLRSVMTLGGLYAVLTFVLITASLVGGISPGFALIFAVIFAGIQFAIGPFLLDFFLRFTQKVRWIDLDELPPHLQAFTRKTCQAEGMKLPRFGMIPDGTPNAFTYGHTPNNARLVLTEGTIELLDPKELEAVVGHEIGHARNWDMALMTLAQLVPMVLYYIYRTLIEVDTDDGRAKAATLGVAIGAYVLYIVSEYVVLWFSRTREYHADRFGAKAAGSARALALALVKIAYGLAGRGGEGGEGGAKKKPRRGGAAAIGAMGIFDGGAAQSLAVASYSTEPGGDGGDEPPKAGGYTVEPDALIGAMKWDLWNPWATWYEIHSTHPLVAKRILHLGAVSEEMGEEPLVRFDLPKPESFMDEFLVDVGATLLPWVGLAVGAAIAIPLANPGPALLLWGVGLGAKYAFRYRGGDFPEMSVATLLRQVKVSDVRPVPCRLKGTVRGRGVPGLIWSEDFVMQDDTGIIFLDLRQPLAIWEWIWGWMRGGKLVGGVVEVEGWYRRAPMPYVEIKRFTVDGVERRSWLWTFRFATAGVIAALGALAIVVF